MTDDNSRQAAALKVSISNYVGTASLAVIAGAVALFTYVQQNFYASATFSPVMLLAVIALVLSFIFGGRGANSTASELAKGTWTAATKTRSFNVQATLALAGVCLILVSAWIGTMSQHRVQKDPCVSLLSVELSKPDPKVDQLQRELTACEATR